MQAKVGRAETLNQLGLESVEPEVAPPLREVQASSPPIPVLHSALSVLKQRKDSLSATPPTVPPPPMHCSVCHSRATRAPAWQGVTSFERLPGTHTRMARAGLYPSSASSSSSSSTDSSSSDRRGPRGQLQTPRQRRREQRHSTTYSFPSDQSTARTEEPYEPQGLVFHGS